MPPRISFSSGNGTGAGEGAWLYPYLQYFCILHISHNDFLVYLDTSQFEQEPRLFEPLYGFGLGFGFRKQLNERTGIPSVSRHSVVPHSLQKNDVIVWPESAVLLYVFGSPVSRRRAVVGTIRLVLYMLPLIRLQSVQ